MGFSITNVSMIVSFQKRYVSTSNMDVSQKKKNYFRTLFKRQNFVLNIAESIVGKRQKCWLSAFSPFPTMFSKDFFASVVKIGIVG